MFVFIMYNEMKLYIHFISSERYYIDETVYNIKNSGNEHLKCYFACIANHNR